MATRPRTLRAQVGFSFLVQVVRKSEHTPAGPTEFTSVSRGFVRHGRWVVEACEPHRYEHRGCGVLRRNVPESAGGVVGRVDGWVVSRAVVIVGAVCGVAIVVLAYWV